MCRGWLGDATKTIGGPLVDRRGRESSPKLSSELGKKSWPGCLHRCACLAVRWRRRLRRLLAWCHRWHPVMAGPHLVHMICGKHAHNSIGSEKEWKPRMDTSTTNEDRYATVDHSPSLLPVPPWHRQPPLPPKPSHTPPTPSSRAVLHPTPPTTLRRPKHHTIVTT